ncbi:polyprenyl synthetase family protein [Mariluticola halotolerans]|uniref:polyprenyl synthetase family protein n=1 Tax=Mariluticola halotolerans TaxID=2909283 RepID=UPI0026E38BBC|nr:farnesyl diphosphate synthase [Mariluticola halotolerans]UJQ93767.1 polyprenyl synthetase family protein [Mariluticola halotolerans]
MTPFEQEARDCARDIEAALDALLARARLSGPGPAPERLIAAMRHGTLNGGKRLRPLLLRQTAGIFQLPPAAALDAGLAVELVHCYSLVHDDLPAMDDDDMRRGKPTVHKMFNEATAVLAGDSLLTHAFGLLATSDCHADPAVRIALVTELVAGAGAGGMAGGQMRDLDGENARVTDSEIATMQKMKTGALIRAAVRMGAILGNASPEQLDALTHYAEAAGRAFQLADDILDETATEMQMGKKTGKDAGRGKPTLIARIGIDAANKHLADTIHNAITALTCFGPEADGLRATARYFGERQS